MIRRNSYSAHVSPGDDLKETEPRNAAVLLQTSPMQYYFWATSQRITAWVRLLLPFEWTVPDELASSPHPSHCYALTVSVHLVLGLLLPSMAVYIWERQSRANFLAESAAGSGLRLVDAAEQLGLPRNEGLSLCLFDPVAAWSQCLILLPALAALTWVSVYMLAPL